MSEDSSRSIAEWQHWLSLSMFTLPPFARVEHKKVLFVWTLIFSFFPVPWFLSDLVLMIKDWDQLSSRCELPHKITV